MDSTTQDPSPREPQNLRALSVRFIAPTDYRGARVKITDLRGISKPKTIPYSRDYDSASDEALAYLTRGGWPIVAQAETPDAYILLTSDFRREEI